MSEQQKNGRFVYLDYLRVLASFMVMVAHSASESWYAADIYSREWEIYNLFDSICRWSVPAFVMISGVIFLNRNFKIREIYYKYVIRLVTAYFFWSTFYAFINFNNTTERLYAIFKGEFHMWFIPMMIGLYISLPVMNLITRDPEITVYYLYVSILFVYLLPTFTMIISHFGGSIFNRIFSAVYDWINKFDIKFFFGFASYFILGYYLNKTPQNKKQRIIYYILGITGIIATIILTQKACQKYNRRIENYYTNMTMNVFLSAVGIFIWFKHRSYHSSKFNSLIQKMSKYSFSAYIIHVSILNKLTEIGVPDLIPNIYLSVLLTSAITFLISYIISALLNHIPFLNRFIV